MTGEGPPGGTDRHAELDETIVGGEGEDAEAPLEEAYPPGTSISRYIVLEKIGEGGMGVVLAAFDPELGRRIALKILLPRRRTRQGGRVPAAARLMREAQAIARLSHPNVVNVYDVGRDGDSVFVAMEYIEGLTLTTWLERVEPDLPTLLETFAKAGRGLAAAHRAGLVHRDFKPDNVLVSPDGRVRVLDFGLARAERSQHSMSVSRTGEDDSAPSQPRRVPDWESDVLSSPLTRDDAVVGTPRYMAPEQHAGLPTDGRSDQYSFCVALYQALFRQEPFPARSLRQIVKLKADGRVAPPPKGVTVPPWLEEIVLKGLSPRPDDRFESMDDLVDRLLETPEVKRRRWMLYLAGLAIVGVAAVFALRGEPEVSVCAGSETQLDAIWNPSRRESVETAIAAVPLPYAAHTANEVGTRLGAYAEAWTSMHRDTCEATHVRKEQSETLMDRRMACLANARTQLTAILDIFEDPDEAVVERATQAVGALPDLEACEDVTRLLERSQPAEGEARPVVDQIEAKLAQAAAMESAGRYSDGLELAEAALAEADTIDYPPVRADVLDRLGSLMERTGDYAGAEKRLREALWLAIAHGQQRRAASAATDLVQVVGDRLARYDEGLVYGEHASALLDHLGLEGKERARLCNSLGNVLYRKGETARAREQYERGLEIRERISGPDDPSLGTQMTNLGNVLMAEGDYDAALERFRRGRHIVAEALGEAHPLVAVASIGIGNVHSELGRTVEARAEFEAARGMLEKSFGPEHPFVAICLLNIAQTYTAEERYEEALAPGERALMLIERGVGSNHPDYAAALVALADIHAGLERWEEAREEFEAALRIRRAVHGPDDDRVARVELALARLTRREGDSAGAIEPLQAAIERLEATEADDRVISGAYFDLARATFDGIEDLEAARAHARRAVEILRDVGARGEEDREQIEAWLREHPAAPADE